VKVGGKISAPILNSYLMQIVDDEIEPSFRNNIQEFWEDLKGSFPISKNNEVVPDQVKGIGESTLFRLLVVLLEDMYIHM
jgi:hypothetical protein